MKTRLAERDKQQCHCSKYSALKSALTKKTKLQQIIFVQRMKTFKNVFKIKFYEICNFFRMLNGGMGLRFVSFCTYRFLSTESSNNDVDVPVPISDECTYF